MAKARRWGSEGKVLDRADTCETGQEMLRRHDKIKRVEKLAMFGPVRPGYLWSGVAAFLKAGLATQRAAQGGRVMV